MSAQPFRETVQRLAETMDPTDMAVHSDRARSHTWWRKMRDLGAWGQITSGGAVTGRVGPPDPEALPGIAKLFGTTVDHVAAMVAADWYGVHSQASVLSPRTRAMATQADLLTEEDAEHVQWLVDRLAHPTTG